LSVFSGKNNEVNVEFKIPEEKIIFSKHNTRGDILANQMYMIALNMPSKNLEFSEVDFN
jgi:hypothetical protein